MDEYLAAYSRTLNESRSLEIVGATHTDLAHWEKDPVFITRRKEILQRHMDDLMSKILLEPKTTADKKAALELFKLLLGGEKSTLLDKKKERIESRMGLPK